jgi:hypothetical protein
MDQATWLFGGTPNDPDAARIVIQQVVRDLNLDPRKVFLVNDWRFGGTSQIGITNSDLVAGIGVWAISSSSIRVPTSLSNREWNMQERRSPRLLIQSLI